MTLFKKKKEEKSDYNQFLSAANIKVPGKRTGIPYGTEYLTFLKETKRKPETRYEKMCAFAQKILNIKVDKKTEEKLASQLYASYINAQPSGVISFAVLVLSLFLTLALFTAIARFGSTFSLTILLLGATATYYVYSYPNRRAKILEVKMGSDVTLAILYMIIYMRNSPNLEGAIRFASENLTGPLSWDMKKILWDVEVGRYTSVDTALGDYAERWRAENEQFSRALQLLRSSLQSVERERYFEESINTVINGTREKMLHYASAMRMPLLLIHAMGILLPVMGLVLFPIVAIFMAESVKPIFLFIGYDIILPLILMWYISAIISKRPPTFSQPDISLVKGVPPLGKIKVGNFLVPVWPFAILAAIPFLVIGLSGLNSEDVNTSVGTSVILVFGICVGIAVYGYLDSYQKLQIRRDIEKIEDEFGQALFQLGNELRGGTPVEVAVRTLREKMRGTSVVKFFGIIDDNMRDFGMTFHDAIFDKERGVLRYYPSNMVRSIMQVITEASRVGVSILSGSMITISRYLKNIHDLKEEIHDSLDETLTSLSFMGMLLAPMVAGVTVTMAIIIIQILTSLGAQITTLTQQTQDLSAAQSFTLLPWAAGGAPPISPQMFQLIVGLYMLETALLIAVFHNRVTYGEDKVGERISAARMVSIAVVIYILSWVITYTIFSDPIAELLKPV